VLTWAEETRTTRLRANLFDPGPVATRMRAQAMPGENPASLPTPAEVAPAVAALCLPDEARHGSLVSFRR
jgi:NAD(P)-dependent dehydrogenase (short-subunit alcohol dehydrogenase family)